MKKCHVILKNQSLFVPMGDHVPPDSHVTRGASVFGRTDIDSFWGFDSSVGRREELDGSDVFTLELFGDASSAILASLEVDAVYVHA
jgi:hypothetical protein